MHALTNLDWLVHVTTLLPAWHDPSLSSSITVGWQLLGNSRVSATLGKEVCVCGAAITRLKYIRLIG
jgi:hypothetical protein